MIVDDVIWGKTEIKDKKIIQIIKHHSMRRLKNIWISAYGYLFELKRNATRYEHCLGVYLLLNKFSASKEEQAAGLIHDVSTTALSHVSTYAIQGKYSGKEFHELQHKNFIEETGLDTLLIKLGLDAEKIIETDNFPLLENNLPDVCADRIDYALRDGLHLQTLSKQQVTKILKGLVVHGNEFVFNNVESAYLYSFNFYLLNLLHYGSPAEAHFNNDFGRLVNYAVKKGVLSEKDWFTDDINLTNKLRNSKDKKVKQWLAKYNNKLIIYEDTEASDETYSIKIRCVDPKVMVGKRIQRLSEISSDYKILIDTYKKQHQKHELLVRVKYRK